MLTELPGADVLFEVNGGQWLILAANFEVPQLLGHDMPGLQKHQCFKQFVHVFLQFRLVCRTVSWAMPGNAGRCFNAPNGHRCGRGQLVPLARANIAKCRVIKCNWIILGHCLLVHCQNCKSCDVECASRCAMWVLIVPAVFRSLFIPSSPHLCQDSNKDEQTGSTGGRFFPWHLWRNLKWNLIKQNQRMWKTLKDCNTYKRY